MTDHRIEAAVERIDVTAYKIPTDSPEADGTYAWDSTTLVARRGHRRRHGAASATPMPIPRPPA